MDSPRSLSGARVLVTGATGFLGSQLCRRLATREGATVTGIGRDLEKVRDLEADGVQLKRVGLDDVPALRSAAEGQDIVFHSAAVLVSDPALAEAVNVAGTERLIRAAGEEGVRRWVQVSTVGVYAMSPGCPVPEDTPLALEHPASYPRTKARSEAVAFAVGRELGMEVTALRPSQIYGPGRGVWTVQMLENIRNGRPAFLGNGSAHFCPVHVADVVDALIRASTRPEAGGEAFNISVPPITWREFMGCYGAMVGRRPKGIPVFIARLMAAANRIPGVSTPLDAGFIEMATSRNSFPIDKAKRLLGWEPTIGLEEGMQGMAEWFRKEGLLPA